MSFKIAFYKANRPGLKAIYSWGVRTWTRSAYSHCEMIFSNGIAASSSLEDGGVRFKQIDFNDGHWDIVELPDHMEAHALAWFQKNQGAKYDIMGNLHFILSPIGDDADKWFCSEAIACALGLEKAGRFNPGDLYEIAKLLAKNHAQAA